MVVSDVFTIPLYAFFTCHTTRFRGRNRWVRGKALEKTKGGLRSVQGRVGAVRQELAGRLVGIQSRAS